MRPWVLRVTVADVTVVDVSSAWALMTGALSVQAESRNAITHAPAAKRKLIVLFILNLYLVVPFYIRKTRHVTGTVKSTFKM